MSACDKTGNLGEAFIGFALIFKAICGYRNFVNLALPLAHEPCSSFESLPGVILPLGVQRGRNLLQLSSGFGLQAAMGQFLDPEGKYRGHELSAKTWRCWAIEALLPQLSKSRPI